MQSVLSVVQSPLVSISVSDFSSMIVVIVILRNGISKENIERLLFSDRNIFQFIQAFYETSLSGNIAMGTRGGPCGPSWG